MSIGFVMKLLEDTTSHAYFQDTLKTRLILSTQIETLSPLDQNEAKWSRLSITTLSGKACATTEDCNRYDGEDLGTVSYPLMWNGGVE